MDSNTKAENGHESEEEAPVRKTITPVAEHVKK